MWESFKQSWPFYRIMRVVADRKFHILIYSFGTVHTLMLFLFIYLHVLPMVIFNIFSVTTYIICSFLINYHEEYLLHIFYVSYLEILLHSLFASVCIGWQYGFTLYVIALIPFGIHMCYNLIQGWKKYFMAVLLSMIAFFNYIFCRLVIMVTDPLYSLDHSRIFESFIYIFNVFNAFLFMAGITLIFLFDIHFTTNKLNMQNALLEKLANTDPLTGLYNRRSMQVFLDHAAERDTEVCLAMCDIDDFKKVNDTYGHDAGDVVLKEISGIMRQMTEGSGYVCRWGGEEILILTSQSMEKTKLMLDKIRRSVANHLFVYNEQGIRCSITIGLAEHKHGSSMEDTINLADYNLYCGKRNGKNKVVA